MGAASWTGYDPFATLEEHGIRQEPELADAVAAADVVISLVGARAAESVARDALSAMRAGSVLADFNTGSPALKQVLGEAAAARAVLFADVAVLAPVPRAGAKTPLMVSGRRRGAIRGALRSGPRARARHRRGRGRRGPRGTRCAAFRSASPPSSSESTSRCACRGLRRLAAEQIAAEFAGDAPQLIERLDRRIAAARTRRAHEVDDAKASSMRWRRPRR